MKSDDDVFKYDFIMQEKTLTEQQIKDSLPDNSNDSGQNDENEETYTLTFQ